MSKKRKNHFTYYENFVDNNIYVSEKEGEHTFYKCVAESDVSKVLRMLEKQLVAVSGINSLVKPTEVITGWQILHTKIPSPIYQSAQLQTKISVYDPAKEYIDTVKIIPDSEFAHFSIDNKN